MSFVSVLVMKLLVKKTPTPKQSKFKWLSCHALKKLYRVKLLSLRTGKELRHHFSQSVVTFCQCSASLGSQSSCTRLGPQGNVLSPASDEQRFG